jgi:MFS family permease
MGAPDPRDELADVQLALEQEHSAAHERVFQWKYRYPLFLAITIGAFNQLAGINAVWYYAQSIFAAAGISTGSGFAQTMVLGATNLVFTFAGMALIDHFDRKSLLIVGAIGTTACLSGISWIYVTHSHQLALLGFLVVFIAFFAASQGAVIWVNIGEVFQLQCALRGKL